MGTSLGPKYIPYTHMDPLGMMLDLRVYGQDCDKLFFAHLNRRFPGKLGIPQMLSWLPEMVVSQKKETPNIDPKIL